MSPFLIFTLPFLCCFASFHMGRLWERIRSRKAHEAALDEAYASGRARGQNEGYKNVFANN
jgi:transketolase C-terminal domain/subunit